MTAGISWGVSLKRTTRCCQVHDRTAKVPSVVSDLEQHGSEKARKQALPSKSEYFFFPASHTFAQLLSRPSQAPGTLELPLSHPWAWDRCSGLQNVTGLSSCGSKHKTHACPSCPVSCALSYHQNLGSKPGLFSCSLLSQFQSISLLSSVVGLCKRKLGLRARQLPQQQTTCVSHTESGSPTPRTSQCPKPPSDIPPCQGEGSVQSTALRVASKMPTSSVSAVAPSSDSTEGS